MIFWETETQIVYKNNEAKDETKLENVRDNPTTSVRKVEEFYNLSSGGRMDSNSKIICASFVVPARWLPCPHCSARQAMWMSLLDTLLLIILYTIISPLLGRPGHWTLHPDFYSYVKNDVYKISPPKLD